MYSRSTASVKNCFTIPVRRTDSGPRGSPGRGRGRPARGRGYGTPTGNTRRRSANSYRPGSPGTSPRRGRLDQSRSHSDNRRTSPDTTPKRCRACHTIPKDWPASYLQDGFFLRSRQTTHTRPTQTCCHQSCIASSSPRGTPTPTPPPSVIDTLAPLTAPQATTTTSGRTPPRLPNSLSPQDGHPP